MASKTVEFIRLDLFEKYPKKQLKHSKLKEIIEDIFDKHCVNNPGCRTLDLTPNIKPEDIDPKIILDVFDMKSFLFARVCKKKSNNAILRRNYSSLKPEEVFTPAETAKLGIEVFTYLILDFSHGIISIANAQDAPGASILNWIFENYNNNYILEFQNIPNQDGINALYNASVPVISGYEFEIPSPNARYLEQILGMNEEQIAKIVTDRVHKAIVILKPEPYGSIDNGTNRIRDAINILRGVNNNFSKTIIKGRSEEFHTKDFDLHAKYFTYPITVKRHHTVDGKKVEYNLDEITEQFKDGLFSAYYKNDDLILAISNREDDEGNEVD